MKLLLDQHLSRKLVSPLEQIYPGVSHVITHQLEQSDDKAVWHFAQKHGCMIVTKDQDYQVFSFMWGHPPKVVWLRIGNGPSKQVLEVLVRAKQAVEAFEGDETRSLLCLP